MSKWSWSECGRHLLDQNGDRMLSLPVKPSCIFDEQQFNALRCIPELLEIVAAYNRNPETCHFKIRQAIQHAQNCMSDSE